MARVDADRNLLLGILAVQMDFVTRDSLFEAMKAWIFRKETALSALLIERGELAKSRADLLEALVDEHVRAHGGDPARSLQALTSVGPVAEDLGHLADTDLQASVSQLRTDLTVPPTADPFATHAPEPLGQPTSWNGRFRVVRPHASGGLGVVSVALDDELDREVAFKEIKHEFADHGGRRAQFVLEAEITGKLEHPGIIPIYGLGHDPGGRPFYAMRFIRGDSLADAIHRYHDPAGPYLDPTKRSLQLRELLGRFLDVCDALAYAHSRGVLHRDLKPGNIMLGPFGETLVVDWGLALPLGSIPEGHESTHLAVKSTKADSASLPREQGTVIGTPHYMSPEQAEGAIDKLGPRSDVYGLGAILYDLLTGKTPVAGSSLTEVLRQVHQGEIKPPRQVRPEIPAPLEAITLKALALKPEDRYATPRALAKDIKAWLADEPVSARPEPLAERGRRWAKKNRTTVTGVAVALLVGLVGLGAVAAVQTRANGKLILANQALDDERIKARASEAQAIAAVKKFGEVIANEPELKQNPALEALRKRLLNEPLAFFRALRKHLQADPDTRPESLARLATASFDLGFLTNEIGNKEDAIFAYRESLAIRQKLADANPAITRFQNDLAASHNNIGLLLSGTGKADEALQSHKKSLIIRRQLVNANPTVTEFQNNLAISHNNIGVLLSATGQEAEALRACHSALAIQQKLADENPAITQFQSNLATSHDNIGLLLKSTGKTVEALQSHKSALAIRQKLADENPAIIEFQSNLATSHDNIGLLLKSIGKPVEALQFYRSALAIGQKLADANPAITRFQNNLARSHDNIGNLLLHTDQTDQALSSYKAALAIRQKLADAYPTVTQFPSALAASHNNIGLLLKSTGKTVEALQSYRSGLAIWQKLADAHPAIIEFQRDLAVSYNNIGRLLSDADQPVQALQYHKEALAIRQKLADSSPATIEFQNDLAASHNNIGIRLSLAGQKAEALLAFKAGLAIQQKLARDHPESPDFASGFGSTLNNIAMIDLAAKRFEEARVRLRDAVIWQSKALAAYPSNPTYRQFLTNHWTNLIDAARGLGDSAGVAEAERELEALRDSDPVIVALDARLSMILRGEQEVKDINERLQLAQRAYDKGLHASAAKLWGDAIEADPRVGQSRNPQFRYNAACAAARAGCGQGRDSPAPDEMARARLRQQALGWLQAEVVAWSKWVDSLNVQAKPDVVQALEHWKQDPDLDGVRNAEALEKLPEAERQGWRSLWAEVDALLAKAKGG